MLATKIILLINLGLSVLANDIIVTIPNGQVQGRLEVTWRGTTFYAFQQIPYGKAPVGELRFKSPQPVDNWDDVFDATTNNKVCYQTDVAYYSKSEPEDEDCLFVNVYTPTYTDINASIPVIVWIYGGGFLHGYANFYNTGPHYFLDDGVVFVTISYRTGSFGFLSTGDEVIPGNSGLKDQNLGLQWVRDNIKYFGGEPEKVTIMGGSAGGASVSYHLQSSKSRGLYRAAIAQSGSNLVPWAYQRNHRDVAYKIAENLGISVTNSSELLDALQAVPAADLKEASNFEWDYAFMQGFTFTPVIELEHDDAFITNTMYSAVADGNMDKVPLLMGINSEEMLSVGQTSEHLDLVSQNLDSNLSAMVCNNMHLTGNEDLSDAGMAIRCLYTDGLFSFNTSNTVRFYSDNCFTRSIVHHAALQSHFSDVYFYKFSYHGDMGENDIEVRGCGRVRHGEEGKYLWVKDNNSRLDDNAPSDVLTADRFRTLITNFAKYLHPTPEETELFQNITWPKVTPDNFQYLNVDNDLTIEVNPRSDYYSKWVDLYENYAVKPYDTF